MLQYLAEQKSMSPRRPKNKIPRKRTKKLNQEKWIDVKQELRPKFIAAGILNTCELYNVREFKQAIKEQLGKEQNCTRFLFLTFAHSLRRNIINKYDGEKRARLFRDVIRACQNCHKYLDSLDHDTTAKIVRNVKSKRLIPV